MRDLLGRYVNLLESNGHGGWSREEERAVRAARTALTGAGLTGAGATRSRAAEVIPQAETIS